MVQIDFGSTISVSHTMIEAADLPTTPTESTSGDHVNVAFNWTDGTNGSWKELFTFKTDSIDLTNTAVDDIVYQTNVSEFYSSNILSATGFTLSDGSSVGASVVAAPTGGTQSVANEFVRKMANTIFARANAADLLSNEAELVADITNDWGTGSDNKMLNDIHNALTPTGYETTQTESNPGAIVLNTLIRDSNSQGRFIQSSLASSTTDSEYNRIPLEEDDELVFSVTIKAAAHTIGTNSVADRKYKFVVTLKG